VLRRIFGPRRFEGTGGWRKLDNEELLKLCPSPRIIRMVKLRRMRWAWYVTRMEKMNACRLFVGNLRGNRPLNKP
jgi:hypothetical protein